MKLFVLMYFRTSWKMYTSHEDIGYDFEDDPKDKKTLKPHPDIDGGWAWMMVLSSFFVHILIMGSQMALGVLNVEWLEEFHQSRGLTAWVSSLSMGVTLIVGMFTCDLLSIITIIWQSLAISHALSHWSTRDEMLVDVTLVFIVVRYT